MWEEGEALLLMLLLVTLANVLAYLLTLAHAGSLSFVCTDCHLHQSCHSCWPLFVVGVTPAGVAATAAHAGVACMAVIWVSVCVPFLLFICSFLLICASRCHPHGPRHCHPCCPHCCCPCCSPHPHCWGSLCFCCLLPLPLPMSLSS